MIPFIKVQGALHTKSEKPVSAHKVDFLHIKSGACT